MRNEMPTRNINLTEHFDRFVDKQVGAGRFRNASEVMRAGLHLLEQQTREDEQKLALLRALAAEGIEQLDQGRGLAVKDERELANVVAQIGRRVAGPAKRNARSS
jgi:antitoxin ParD1/3/4